MIDGLCENYASEVKQVTNDGQIAEIKRQLAQLETEETRLGRLFITGKIYELISLFVYLRSFVEQHFSQTSSSEQVRARA